MHRASGGTAPTALPAAGLAGTISPMGQQDMSDQEMLQHAGDSATRLLRHLARHASLSQGTQAMPDTAVAMTPASELETAIMSLRRLIAVLNKEPDTR